jgi:predicted transcriptional regulator
MTDSPTIHDPDELRHRRIEAGLNQIDLANLTGLHQTYISYLERGLKNPTPRTLKAIADALPECEVVDLLRKRSDRPKAATRTPKAPEIRGVAA